jgi:hypothetical protein
MKRIVKGLIVVALSALALGLFAACTAGAGSIDRVVVGSQESNEVAVKNYTVFLKDTVDWSALSENDREKVAVAGFEEAQKKITEDGTHNYSISGIANDQQAFLYDGVNKTMIIYLDDEKVGEVAVTVPE